VPSSSLLRINPSLETSDEHLRDKGGSEPVIPRITTSNAWAPVGLVGALATALYLVVSPVAEAFVFVGILAGTSLSVLAGIKIHRPEVPRPWSLLAIGLVFKALGDVIWYIQNLFADRAALVLSTNLCFLFAYSLFIASLVQFVRLRDFQNSRALMLDTTMLLVNVGVISWTFLIHPVFLEASATWTEQVILISFPIVNLVLLGGVVALILSNGRRPLSFYLLSGAFLLHLFSDTLYYANALRGTYEAGSAADVPWLLGYVLIAMAALHPSMKRLQRPSAAAAAPLTRSRIVWFAVAALLGPATLVVQGAGEITIFQAVGVTSAALLVLLVLARMAGLVYGVQSRVVQIQRSEQKYRALAHNFPNGAVMLFDRELRLLVADGAGLQRAGVSSDDLEGRTLQEALPSVISSQLEPHFRRALAGDTSRAEIETRGETWEIHGTPVRDEKGDVFAGLVLSQDVTKRKWAETLLERQAATMQMILGATHLKDVLEHIAAVIEDRARGAHCSIMLLDKKGGALRQGASPSLHPDYNHAVDGIAIGPETGSCGTAAFTGTDVVVSDIATDPLWKDTRDLALVYGLRACYASPISSAEGKTLGTIALYYEEPMEPPADHIEVVRLFTQLAGIAVERRVAEERGAELESQLRQSQKMEAVGQLAGGIAHDFNNILSVIRNYAVFVRDEFEPGQLARGDVDEIVQASDRARDLVRQLLTFSRKDVVNPQVLDLNDVVAGAQKLFRRTMRENLSLSVDLAPGNPSTRIDAGQLDQILLNLVVNARDAMPEGGSLTIATGYAPDGRDGERPGQLSGDDYVTLSVADTGCGMEEEVKSRVFEPFFTTKAPGEGTGLGLAMVYGIVEAAGGHVAVESVPGRGTTFTLYLPATSEEIAGVSDQEPVEPAKQSKGHRILVVEDEEAVRRLVGRILRGRGYEVVEARSGADALARLDAIGGRVDLLLTDVRMPGMSGRELALNVQMLHPGIKTLYMSGYAEQALAEDSIRGLDSWIQKPFSAETLLTLVQRTLEETAAIAGATSLN
jgi:two-component system, cell cycle sensor histidine kinase and response regulator CckA